MTEILEKENHPLDLPRHIGIILDGNGRWAKAHGLPRALGHKKGCETLEQIVEDCARLGIAYLTVYGFSTENWKRSSEEVSALMQLFRFYMKKLVQVANRNNVKAKMIGERSRFAPDIQEGIRFLEESTKENSGMEFIFAVNYGGRDEIIRAIHRIVESTEPSRVGESFKNLTEEELSSFLDTAGIPDPDLIIRTSGEFRTSNFLLWQSAYAEYYITDVLWPDFTKEELLKAIENYQKRERRYGGR